MDHRQATENTAIEKYLLSELTPEARDEFEEHFFDCQECATDLRVTAGFIDAAKKEFKAKPVPKPGAVPKGKSHWAPLWGALAACLLVIAYQNMVVLPRFKTEVAELKAPEILPSFSLAGGNSRGGEIPAFTVKAEKPFLLLFDIPTQDRFSGYRCLLYSPSGSLVLQGDVSAQSARDTISIRVPPGNRQSGSYTLAVRGNEAQSAAGSNVDLVHYRFMLTSLE